MAPKPQNAIGSNEFRCACCEHVFEKTRTDEEAMAEAKAMEEHTGPLGDDPACVCDDCYKRIMKVQ